MLSEKKKYAHIYLREAFIPTWETFKKICKREGKNINQHILEFVFEYVERHKDGNPQTILDFASERKCLPRYKVCVWSKGFIRDGLFKCNHPRQSQWYGPKICDECFRFKVEE